MLVQLSGAGHPKSAATPKAWFAELGCYKFLSDLYSFSNCLKKMTISSPTTTNIPPIVWSGVITENNLLKSIKFVLSNIKKSIPSIRGVYIDSLSFWNLLFIFIFPYNTGAQARRPLGAA